MASPAKEKRALLSTNVAKDVGDNDSTELKLAMLASVHPTVDPGLLLDFLLAADGSVEAASALLSNPHTRDPKKKSVLGSLAYQSSLSNYATQITPGGDSISVRRLRALTKKGRTLHVYSPEDVAAHTPCSIIHNFLLAEEANDLLRELLVEAPTYERQTFKLFENVVQSPHTASFYVESLEEQKRQKTEYLYNGAYLTDVRQILPNMRKVSSKVQEAVNIEVVKRIKSHYPGGEKLRFQSSKEWIPNAAFVNCYNGGAESVGYHSDQMTYLGPRAVIGSLSLGVSREFRVRKVVPMEEEEEVAVAGNKGKAKNEKSGKNDERGDAQGQISIHLPHNSLLVMHAEMQEEWKHSIAPAAAIDPHPIAGNKRLNITYRHYPESFHPRHTPKCKCDVASVLRVVQRKKESWGRYFWMCHAGAVPVQGKKGCTFFQWAEFDDDGEPPWTDDFKGRSSGHCNIDPGQ